LLQEKFPEHTWEISTFTTTGDRILDRPLSEFGGKGVFLKEIEEALLSGEADVAIHSLKDVPALETAGLHLSAYLSREDPRDVWVSLQEGLLHLKPGKTVGTSSLRRAVQVRFYRSDLKVEPLRGNLDTRFRKLKEGQYDAIIVAAAGLHRLQLFDETCMHYLLEDGFIPAIGQGILVLQTRNPSENVSLLVQQVNDPVTETAARIERNFLGRFQGGCHLPIGGHATKKGDLWHFRAFIGGVRSGRIVQDSVEHTDPDSCASLLYETLQRHGAQELLSELTDV
jgi:hydroxymethylbilane synthase